MKAYQAIADCLVAEGTEVLFGLMGDGCLELVRELHGRGVPRVIEVRHEGAGLAMADGHARATGRVGVAFVTSGPGLTQVATSLVAAARHGTPLVVIAGAPPADRRGSDAIHPQNFDHAAFAHACEAQHLELRGPEHVAADLQRAFYSARSGRRPVILTAPMDLQEADVPDGFEALPSDLLLRPAPIISPDPKSVIELADALQAARRPILIAGAGAVRAGARPSIEKLAARIGAPLSTTLYALGFFEGHPWSLGLAGGYSRPAAESAFARADLVIAVGASLNANTTRQDRLFPAARLAAINSDPGVLVGGRRAPDLTLVADAARGVDAIEAVLAARGHTSTGLRTPELALELVEDERLTDLDEAGWELPQGTVDPREAMLALDAALPDDAVIAVGVGHFSSFPATYLRPRDREFFFVHDFGAIGQVFATGLGIAVARPDRPTVIIDGDASFLMQPQELDTAVREAIHVLVVAINDGTLGAEFQRLRIRGVDPSSAVIKTPDLAQVAKAFGACGHRCDAIGAVAQAVQNYLAGSGPHLADVVVSPKVVSRHYRVSYAGGRIPDWVSWR
jgi:acetolactate synthase-1/2/3 large subunit